MWSQSSRKGLHKANGDLGLPCVLRSLQQRLLTPLWNSGLVAALEGGSKYRQFWDTASLGGPQILLPGQSSSAVPLEHPVWGGLDSPRLHNLSKERHGTHTFQQCHQGPKGLLCSPWFKERLSLNIWIILANPSLFVDILFAFLLIFGRVGVSRPRNSKWQVIHTGGGPFPSVEFPSASMNAHPPSSHLSTDSVW